MFEQPAAKIVPKAEKPHSENITTSTADAKLTTALAEFSDFHLHNVNKFTPEEQKQWNRTIIDAQLSRKELAEKFQQEHAEVDKATISQILPLLS